MQRPPRLLLLAVLATLALLVSAALPAGAVTLQPGVGWQYSEPFLIGHGATRVLGINRLGGHFADVHFLTSQDGGTTWLYNTNMLQIHAAQGGFAPFANFSDPTGAQLQDGTIVIGDVTFGFDTGNIPGVNCAGQSAFLISASYDGGKTWRFLQALDYHPGTFPDRPDIAADQDPGHPDAFWYTYNGYTNNSQGFCSAHNQPHEFGVPMIGYCDHDDLPCTPTVSPSFGAVVHDPMQHLLVIGHSAYYLVQEGTGNLFLSKCDVANGAVTCVNRGYVGDVDPTDRDGAVFPDAGSGNRVATMPGAVASPDGKKLLAYWLDMRYCLYPWLGCDPAVVTSISTNGGATWPFAYPNVGLRRPYVHDGEQELPAAEWNDPNGPVLCMVSQDTPEVRRYTVGCLRGDSIGSTWQPFVPLAHVDQTDPQFNIYTNAFFGDYMSITDDTLAFVTTTYTPGADTVENDALLAHFSWSGCAVSPAQSGGGWLLIGPLLCWAWRRRRAFLRSVVLMPILAVPPGFFDTPTPGTGSALHVERPVTSPTPRQLVGDCDHDGHVRINELQLGVSIALEQMPASACPAMQCGQTAGVRIDCLMDAVHNALTY